MSIRKYISRFTVNSHKW